MTPSGDAFYNMKLAVKYKDKEAFSKYFNIFYDTLEEQERLGTIGRSIVSIVQSMHPLSGMNTIEKAKFMTSLNDDEKDTLQQAIDFYANNLGNIEKMNFEIKQE